MVPLHPLRLGHGLSTPCSAEATVQTWDSHRYCPRHYQHLVEVRAHMQMIFQKPFAIGGLVAIRHQLHLGTIVEYAERRGFKREYARAGITRIGYDVKHPECFKIKTNADWQYLLNLAICGTPLVYPVSDTGVYLWANPGAYAGTCHYAVAGPGVDIPAAEWVAAWWSKNGRGW